jgi:signal transduction histidine kinase
MPLETPAIAAALTAYLALGANLLGTGFLLQIHPRSRAVRWHALFAFWIMAWLALQGWLAIRTGPPELFLAYGWVVHLLPAFFCAAALVDTRHVPDRVPLAVVLLGAVTAPWLNPAVAGHRALVWQGIMWGVPAVLHLTSRKGRGRAGDAGAGQDPGPARGRQERWPPGKRGLDFALFVVVPAGVLGVILLRGPFLLYAMPLITVVIQFLIFHGVVHHRFYDIEVRAARTGELASAAAEQERLALLGELSATLAHEIRNPLAGIRSLAQRLAQPELDGERRARYADVVLGEIGRLDRIVGNLLDAARHTAVRAEPAVETDLAPLLDDVRLLVDARARRAGVTVRSRPTGLHAAAPRDALAQALLNLVLNAIAHSPAGGEVEIDARAAGPAIELRVRDSGPGVPPHERALIFEPFRTRGIGAGLGLAVVRRLARELGWEITVEDPPRGQGTGAVFTLRLPAAGATPVPGGAVAAGIER